MQGIRATHFGSTAGWARALLFGSLVLCTFACRTAQAPASEQPAAAATEETVAPLVRSAEQSRDAGDFDTAIRAYGDAFGRTPWNTKLKRALAVTHSERAAAQRQKGSLEPAEKDLRTALELYPDDSEFKHSLAVVLLERSVTERDSGRVKAYREEVRSLAPDLKIPERIVNPDVERRVDLAYGLIEKGQLEGGIAELEIIHKDYPSDPSSAHLLAQALVRSASEFSDRKNYTEARAALDRSVSLYAELLPCDGTRCTREELRLAHYNRVVACISAGSPESASSALEEAQAQGFRFRDLEESLARSRPR